MIAFASRAVPGLLLANGHVACDSCSSHADLRVVIFWKPLPGFGGGLCTATCENLKVPVTCGDESNHEGAGRVLNCGDC
jgi:hypothetical protein